MVYAPVVIPTLNRIEHLKNCLTSLRRNKDADKTDIYIALDYPPSPQYEEGYRKVKEYLMGGIEGFNSINVIERTENFGPIDNGFELLTEVFKKHDRCIYSEDDNIFSPCFLEYMNNCLEKYKNDEDILAVYGFRPKVKDQDSLGNRVFKATYFSAYGCGLWKDKHEKMKHDINRNYIEDLSCDRNRIRRLKENYPEAVSYLASALLRKEKVYQTPDGSIQLIDTIRIIHAVAENKYLICSPVRLVENRGYDGSGAHCNTSENMQPGYDLKTDDKECVVELSDVPECKQIDYRLKKKRLVPYVSAILRICIWRVIAKRKPVN